MPFRFHKTERLCSHTIIAKLFEKGNPFLNRFPFRFSWCYVNHEGSFPVQVIFVVSKRNFPKATQRNHIKRQVRELYRLQKHHIYDALPNTKIALSVSYTGKSRMNHAELAPLFNQSFHELISRIQKSN
jgi:ribonuclease P protein component